MTDARSAVKTLLIYAICLPLALTLGYLLANPLDVQGVTLIGIVFLILCAPLAIQYHYPFMLLAFNMGAVVFFLPGRMSLWMVAVALSFGVSFTHRILHKQVRTISVKELTWPLLVLAAVVVLTAEARGGLGMRSMGGDTAGGRRYFEIFAGILAYFALAAQQIPRERVRLYLMLFYLAGGLKAFGMLYGKIPGVFDFIFLFLPPSVDAFNAATGTEDSGMGALHNLSAGGGAVFAYLMARYGIRQMLSPKNRHILFFFGAVVLVMLASGSRSALVFMVLTFTFQFWLEGLYGTKISWAAALALLLAAAVAIPFATKLPYTMQRALSVLPIEVDPMVRVDAEGSSEWRREIWRVTIPQIPEYLLVGKGYAISRSDLAFMTDKAFAQSRVEERAATIAGDYHNGPLSVIMPFGIWGVIAFLWLLWAGGRVLWRNYRYGDPELHHINTYLLTAFLASTVSFFFVFGALATGLVSFTGILGFSVALNGGVARRTAGPPPLPIRFAGRKPGLIQAASPKAPRLPPPAVHS